MAVGFQCHFISNVFSGSVNDGFATCHRAALPALSIKCRQYRAAPVQAVLRWHWAVEADAEGDCIVLHQLPDAARGHALAQAGSGAEGVLRQAPQRPGDAWEKEIENQHQRQCLRQQAGGLGQYRAHCECAGMQAEQGGADQPQGKQHPQRGGNVLRFEVMGQQQEITEHDDHDGIPALAHFKQFQGHEQHQNGDAGFAAEETAEFDADG